MQARARRETQRTFAQALQTALLCLADTYVYPVDATYPDVQVLTHRPAALMLRSAAPLSIEVLIYFTLERRERRDWIVRTGPRRYRPSRHRLYRWKRQNRRARGANPQDRDVPLVVTGGNITPSVQNGQVETTQIAPTILKLLGLNPNALKAVQEEHTQTLPLGSG